MKLLSVVGARPQFVKVAPIDIAIERAGHEHIIVHTGQHYDHMMSDVFFEDLRIPEPHVNLSVGSGSHGAQTGAMLIGLEQAIIEAEPDWVVVYGDTNSTIAAALAAAKLQVPTAHVEAGLRSFNRRMPEEHNRVLTDHCADLLLAPTEAAVGHLEREGLADRTRLVGDVMLDVFEVVRAELLRTGIDRKSLAPDPELGFVLATIHRQENTDDEVRLRAIIDGLSQVSKPVLLAVHPRLESMAGKFGIDLASGSIVPRPPLTYRDLVAAVLVADGVVTDSGGLQKEAFFAGTVCTTIRTETEWVETLDGGWNMLTEPIEAATIAARPAPSGNRGTPFGHGDASGDVVRAIESFSHISA